MDPVETKPAEIKPQKKKEMSWKTFFLYVLLVVAIRLFVVEPHSVSGSSMTETFHDKDYLFVEKLSYKFSDPERGDVIVFNPPIVERTDDRFIKRVIGIPGDTVKVEEGVTYVNGTAQRETFVAHSSTQPASVTLKAGEYFVMGDNRAGSYDSRSWGPITKDEIQGRVLLRLYPFADIGFYPGN
ncbi:MAG: signal peptidase [Candidatus Parcubacteria bacterium]|jgi:signal peptidase I